MSDRPSDALRSAALEAVAETLRSGRRLSLPAELRDDTELARLLDDLAELDRFVLAISHGDLDQRLTVSGSLAGALKSLHASLRHLTWQTQRVAAGDFTQRVDYMGEFSDAFNAMVDALTRMRDELDERNAQLQDQALRLEELATTDPLTGVHNRRKFNELALAEAERARRYGHPLCFLIIDIDRFKLVNDTQGHEAGDQALVALAGLVRSRIRAPDHLARWGGEEFVLLLPDAELDGALELAQRLRAEARACAAMHGATVSIGVAQYRPPETTDDLFARADRALYRAKDLGRDRVEAAR